MQAHQLLSGSGESQEYFAEVPFKLLGRVSAEMVGQLLPENKHNYTCACLSSISIKPTRPNLQLTAPDVLHAMPV
jgi:hypothetical protein